MGMKSRYVWMQGGLVEYEKATVHFLTPALHYGMGVFEGIRCYRTARGPAVFRLREHAERLVNSAKIVGFRSLPFTAEDVSHAISQTVAANGFDECYVRPLIYLSGGGWNLNIDGGTPAFGVAVWEWSNYLGTDALHHGVRANVSSFTRHHPNVMMTKAKVSGNYANSFLAKTESVRLGFEEAIMLDPEGYVAECTGENLFAVVHGTIVTPDLAPQQDGITRDAVITLARDVGYQVDSAPLSRDQLYGADEVFVCGTASEVIGLREIDFRTIGSGSTGPATRRIQEAFHSVIRGRHSRSAQWLEYVDGEETALPGPAVQVA
jgi:branched-chain amino acid aminotransferase